MRGIRKRLIGGVKETFENIRDGKKMVSLELEVQKLRQENRKLKAALKEAEEGLAFLSERADHCKRKINLKNLT